MDYRLLGYNTALLNADIAEKVYIEMAPGYEEFDEKKVPLVMRLSNSQECVREGRTNWRNTLDKHLLESSFKRPESNQCVLIHSEGGALVILTLCVDDVPLLRNHLFVLR